MTVVDESGGTLSGATVSLRGAVDRRSVTGTDGVATLSNIPAGTYRARISRDGFIEFEKEVTIRAGGRLASEAALSKGAPAPMPTPPPAPKDTPKPTPPPTATGPLGQVKVLSISDLAEQMIRDPQPIVEREVGCSVASASRLILVRETLSAHSHADEDEMLYLMAGDATLRIGEKDTQASAGWFALVPRGTTHTLSRRGRNAPIFLSIRSGHPCGG